ncbi:MAG TPA: hypothetical protein VMW45_00220 [Dehalococcoidia bacterium]|nr:hypothetical protein [Dehalococcoidia bacterium]
MTYEEYARIIKYTLILEHFGNRLALLTPYEQSDFKQLLQKCLKELYGEEEVPV